jgi:type VI secretion system protein ImpJ
MASDVLGIIRHRAEAIADRMGDPSVRGTAEVSDFQFLQVLNRFEALLSHYHKNLASLHPERLYAMFVQLAGEISTFTKERRRGIEFSGYRQGDLKSSFEPVVADIRTSLSTVLERSAVEIPLEQRKHNIRVGMVADRGLLSSAGFVLAVRSDLPQEVLRSTLPRQIKVGPVERIAQLINVALPGIAASPLPVAPRQLPFRPGTTYFELERDSDLWKQLNTTGGIAIHLAGDFPAIEIELWAIKT